MPPRQRRQPNACGVLKFEDCASISAEGKSCKVDFWWKTGPVVEFVLGESMSFTRQLRARRQQLCGRLGYFFLPTLSVMAFRPSHAPTMLLSSSISKINKICADSRQLCKPHKYKAPSAFHGAHALFSRQDFVRRKTVRMNSLDASSDTFGKGADA